MANLFQAAKYLASAGESEAAKRRAREQVAATKRAAERQAAPQSPAHELTPEQQRRLKITNAFQQAYRRPALEIKAPPRQAVERTVEFLKRIDAARTSGQLKKRGLRAILER